MQLKSWLIWCHAEPYSSCLVWTTYNLEWYTSWLHHESFSCSRKMINMRDFSCLQQETLKPVSCGRWQNTVGCSEDTAWTHDTQKVFAESDSEPRSSSLSERGSERSCCFLSALVLEGTFNWSYTDSTFLTPVQNSSCKHHFRDGFGHHFWWPWSMLKKSSSREPLPSVVCGDKSLQIHNRVWSKALCEDWIQCLTVKLVCISLYRCT